MAGDRHRTTATILITDQVGSTAQRARVGEDRADDLRREHDELVTSAIERSNGVVIKGTGDGLLARFDSAADAIAGAVGIQLETWRASRQHPDEPFHVRVGVSVGDVTIEDGDCFGTPVIEAARLCDGADRGQILTSELVPLLARGRGGFRFDSIGPREFKGLAEPLGCSVVHWNAPTDTAVPLQGQLERDTRFAFAGREHAIETLREAWKRSRDQAQAVIVSGEPGVGKTRLVTEFVAEASRSGSVVLFGGSDEFVTTPLEPIRSMLAHLVDHLPAETITELAGAYGDVLHHLIPSLRDGRAATGESQSTLDQETVFDAVDGLIRLGLGDAPLVLVFDDLHWADTATLLYLRRVLRHRPQGLLVLATYRDTDLVRGHPLAALLADLRRDSIAERLPLAGLSVDEVTRLMTLAAGHDLAEGAVALAEAIHRETSGNAFFVGEVLTHLAERGDIVQLDGRWQTADSAELVEVPQGVREVIGRRLGQLGSDADAVLRGAAVLGRRFDASIVADVVDVDSDVVLDVIEDAAQRGLLIEDRSELDRYEFTHALVRQALLEELSISRRVRLHHRVVEALVQRGTATSAELAVHACAAAPHRGAERAVEFALAAAADAVGAGAHEDADRWYRHALDAEEQLAPDPLRRAEILRDLAWVRFQTQVEPDPVAEPLVQALSLASAADAATLACRVGFMITQLQFTGVDIDELVETTLASCGEVAERASGDDGDEAEAWLGLAQNLREENAPDATMLLRRAHEAWQTGHRLGSVELSTWAASQLHLAQRGIARPEVYEPGDGDDGDEVAALSRRSAQVASGRFAELDEELRRTLARPLLWGPRFAAHTGAAGAATSRGQLGVARSHEASAQALLDAHRTDDRLVAGADTSLWSCRNLRLIWEQDWEGQLANNASLPSYFGISVVVPLDTNRLVATGQVAEAADLVQRWYTDVWAFVPHWLRPAALAAAAVVGRVGALPRPLSQQLYEHARVFDGRWIGDASAIIGHGNGPVSGFAYSAGRLDEAIERQDAAIAAHEAAGQMTRRASLAQELAVWLLERDRAGDRRRAKQLATEALAGATEIGLEVLAGQTTDLLAEIG